MYTIKETCYSDAGKILKRYNGARLVAIGYSFKVDEAYTIQEESIDLSTIERISDSSIKVLTENGSVIMMGNNTKRTYGDWKTIIIKWRYSNDDQIAIMLNKDESEEDLERYNRMQSWREWASTLSKKIVELNTIS